MSPTTQQFGWKDRDSAARDLLQLVYHAPETISLRALELLQATRSPAVIPELLDIFRDEDRSNWERIYALRAVADTPGDLYLPELKVYLPLDNDEFGSFSAPFREDVLSLVQQHPSNRQWFSDYEKALLDYIDGLLPTVQIERLRKFGFIHREDESLLFALLDRAMKLLEAHPELLDLKAMRWLRLDDPRESTRRWLMAREETLIFLCLTIDMKTEPEKLVYELENWDELRAKVFQACPSLIPEYEAEKSSVESKRTRYFKPVDLMQSSIWRELSELYGRAQGGDKDAKAQLRSRSRAKNILEQAAAVHFLGKLRQAPDFLMIMIPLLKHSSRCEWQSPGGETHTPIVFEAGKALREYPSAQVWETLIDVYFKGIGNVMSDFMRDWIAYQTDRLSGLEVEYTEAIPDVEYRPWFRALVESEKQAE